MSEADRDRSHFDAMQELETELMSALAQGIFETTLTLPTLAWISIVDEIKALVSSDLGEGMGIRSDSIQKAEIVTNADKPATESGIEIISQKSTQSGQGKVTFTVGRLGKRQ